MAKASLKVRGILDSTEMRLPNVGPGEAELVRAERACAPRDCCEPNRMMRLACRA